MRFQTVLTTLGCAAIMVTAVTPAYAATAKDSQLQPEISQKVNRPIHLEGGENMRDLGGYRTKSGQRVKMGKVLRSASLEKLTATDVLNLQVNHQLTEIVALRTTEQIMKKPDPVMEGVKYLQASVLGTRSNYDDDDQGMYDDVAHKAAAILYSILGVSKRDIQRDYLLSNTQLGVTWAKPALLNSFYKQINQQYGSMDKYVKHGLKLSPAQIKVIKTNLLTKAPH
ncbi:tyrosine-protein phosphatase [Levilactobacillus brevis]|uniref:tyrosine-protein phosphatase n=1 Tax=Levilactobacillus brevis TaxID=1580 RepID=UPI002072A5FA|nr:tyrosine-protein phosphatase [Levilactobacillus brevis]MCM6800114.1 tyrosine-protein phosphatase [Levilactobacillus brevis]MCM6801187.1 tyrosine-protein phosphatase [Levilactobacillus brevis]MCM6804482.1 tyrosine-protein phosphatase [Levilactobacillus brevis]MCM6808155.1 tyrosine-protein phosphatase [Levilactobacillus brevis]MCM6814041.1 tyrosine-protein phosphatase [Levilactobacillus brevis]